MATYFNFRYTQEGKAATQNLDLGEMYSSVCVAQLREGVKYPILRSLSICLQPVPKNRSQICRMQFFSLFIFYTSYVVYTVNAHASSLFAGSLVLALCSLDCWCSLPCSLDRQCSLFCSLDCLSKRRWCIVRTRNSVSPTSLRRATQLLLWSSY